MFEEILTQTKGNDKHLIYFRENISDIIKELTSTIDPERNTQNKISY